MFVFGEGRTNELFGVHVRGVGLAGGELVVVVDDLVEELRELLVGAVGASVAADA